MKTNRFEVEEGRRVFWIYKGDYDSYLSIACGYITKDRRYSFSEAVLENCISDYEKGEYKDPKYKDTVFTTLESLKAFLFDLGCRLV